MPRTDAPTRLQDLWEQDRPAFGIWSSLADPVVAALVAGGPFDYTCIDLQHGHATPADAGAVVRAVRAAGRAPAVRVSWNEPHAIMRALDLGASTIVVPMVETADDARSAAAACRYPPRGTRSWGPMWTGVDPGPTPGPDEQNAAVTCLVMVESSAALDHLEEIVDVDGVDGVYIGPNDLALSTGHGRATYRDSPAVERTIQQVITTCREHGVVAGLHCSDPAMAVEWAARGARMLTAAADTALLQAGLAAAASAVGPLGTARDSSPGPATAGRP